MFAKCLDPESEYEYDYDYGDGDPKDYADGAEGDGEYEYGEGDEAATGGADGDAGEDPVIVAHIARSTIVDTYLGELDKNNIISRV